MTSYTYTGPMTGFTLPDSPDVVILPAATYSLPASNEYVATLVALGYATSTGA